MTGRLNPSRYPVAVHLFFVRENRVLLTRRFNTGWEDGKYSVPAGHVEAGEQVTATAVREAREEVGVQLAAADVEVVHVMHRQSDEERVDFFLLVRFWVAELSNTEPEKCNDMGWYGMTVLPENPIPYMRHALDCWQAGVRFCSFRWLGRFLHSPH